MSFLSDHEIATSTFYLRNTEDETALATRTTNNFQRADGRQLRDYDLRYEQRELLANQIRGHHVIGQDTREAISQFDKDWLDGLTLDWYSSDSIAETDIPNEIKFSAEDTVDPTTGDLLSTALRRSNSAADYRFTALEDEVRSCGWDLMKPYRFDNVDVEISGGQDVSDKARSYTQTQFGLGTTALAASSILVGTPETVFTDANILNPAYGFALSVGGIGTESYLAGQTTDAGYSEGRRAGEREVAVRRRRSLGGFPPGLAADRHSAVRRRPAANARCRRATRPRSSASRSRKTSCTRRSRSRASSATSGRRTSSCAWVLAKRSRGPICARSRSSAYIDPLTETRIRGNPGLVSSPIDNVDLRAEWFFENGDNFTVSLFYKDIQRPIETVQGAGTDDNISLTFINAESAEISGLEVEWLKDLSTLGPRWLEPFFFAGNVTLSDSEIKVDNVAFNLTNDVRPMAQHSEYVANLQLGFDSDNGAHTFTLAYNTFGERLVLRRPRRRARCLRAAVRLARLRLLVLPDGPPEHEVPHPEPARRGARDHAARHRRDRAEARHDGEDRREVGSRQLILKSTPRRAQRGVAKTCVQ